MFWVLACFAIQHLTIKKNGFQKNVEAENAIEF